MKMLSSLGGGLPLSFVFVYLFVRVNVYVCVKLYTLASCALISVRLVYVTEFPV